MKCRCTNYLVGNMNAIKGGDGHTIVLMILVNIRDCYEVFFYIMFFVCGLIGPYTKEKSENIYIYIYIL